MPKHLQFNPHIQSGYRPLTNFTGCLASLFYIHNETVNIVTHGLAIVYMLNTIPDHLPWSHQSGFMGLLSWCHLAGAISPWIGSFIYHLFMCLSHDEMLYKKLLKLDMLGIWICQSVGAIPMIVASVHCLPNPLWHLSVILYLFLSFWGLLKAMRATSPWERRLCFLPGFVMRMIFLVSRYLGISGGEPNALTHIILQDLVSVIGGAIGAMRIPEKWVPGQLDLICNSHNIMHVLVVWAAWSMHLAAVQDMAWMSNPSVCKTTNTSFDISHDEL